MTERIIHTAQDIAEGLDHLAACCPRLALARDICREVPLRRRPDGFAELLSAIVSQQVSVASAAAIWERMCRAGLDDPLKIRAAEDHALRDVGLSRQKIRYSKALAEAGIDYDALRNAPTENVIEILTRCPGIGVWTAEIYAMFSLGRADVFAAGDLALQEAARGLYGLSERPGERDLRKMALAWRPWRSVAARLLWAYYREMKNREGIR